VQIVYVKLTEASVGVSKSVGRNAGAEAGENVVLSGETERSVNELTVGQAVARETLRL